MSDTGNIQRDVPLSQFLPPPPLRPPHPNPAPHLLQKPLQWTSLLGRCFVLYRLCSSNSFLKGTSAVWMSCALTLANEAYCWKKGFPLGDQKKITRCFYASSIPVALITIQASLDYLSAIDCILGSVFATGLICHALGKNGEQEFMAQFINPTAFYDKITLSDRSSKEPFVRVAIRINRLIAMVAISSATFIQMRESQGIYKYPALLASTEIGHYLNTLAGVLLNCAVHPR